MSYNEWYNCEGSMETETCSNCGRRVCDCSKLDEPLAKVVAIRVMYDGSSFAVITRSGTCAYLLQIVEGGSGSGSFVGLRGSKEDLTNIIGCVIQIDPTMTSDYDTGQISLV